MATGDYSLWIDQNGTSSYDSYATVNRTVQAGDYVAINNGQWLTMDFKTHEDREWDNEENVI